jgi:very-short-patch-repair endonuclease/predicted transcriptional regulator of viral defense system
MQVFERAIAAIAGRQDNIVTRDQLIAAGVGRGAIEYRLSAGSVHRLHRGVYLVGHAPPTPVGRMRAAVLACGANAVLSHRSAAELWGLLPERNAPVAVTAVGRNPGQRLGIQTHRVAEMDPGELTQMRGIPLTSPARTICDLAGAGPSHETEQALEEARVLRLVTDRQLRQVIERAPTRAGSASIRALLAAENGAGYTRSKAERAMRALVRSADLPQPVVNTELHGFLVDFLWRDERLVVEVDGYEFHRDRAAFERDRRRDQVLTAAGYRVIRVTWRQLRDEPVAVVARLAQALAWAGSGS